MEESTKRYRGEVNKTKVESERRIQWTQCREEQCRETLTAKMKLPDPQS